MKLINIHAKALYYFPHSESEEVWKKNPIAMGNMYRLLSPIFHQILNSFKPTIDIYLEEILITQKKKRLYQRFFIFLRKI